MNNLDEFIKEIRESETLEIKGTLDSDMQWRLEDKIMTAINEESKIISYRKPRRKKWLLLASAAVLVLGLGLTSAAKNEWDISLLNFMGLSEADTLQLEGGEVQIDKTSTSNGITVTATTSIGDKNSAYIRIETDYVLPDTFNLETDYIMPENFSVTISDGADHNTKDYATTFMYYAENGKLCYLFSISNCENLNKSRIQLEIKNLYLYHDLHNPEVDANEELLCEGTWSLDWTYQYKSNAEVYHLLKPFENNGVNYYLTKVEITPISIRIEAFRKPSDRSKAHPEGLIQKITYSDGTSLEIKGSSSSGIRNGMFIDDFIDTHMLGEVIRTKDVKSITISGIEIPLN